MVTKNSESFYKIVLSKYKNKIETLNIYFYRKEGIASRVNHVPDEKIRYIQIEFKQLNFIRITKKNRWSPCNIGKRNNTDNVNARYGRDCRSLYVWNSHIYRLLRIIDLYNYVHWLWMSIGLCWNFEWLYQSSFCPVWNCVKNVYVCIYIYNEKAGLIISFVHESLL